MKAKHQDAGSSARVQEAPSHSLEVREAGMVRTQVYLTGSEHTFLQREAARTGGTMASLIRQYIDEKMALPEDAWANNSLLDPPAEDPQGDGAEDASINLDHYLYETPKRYRKVRGKWVLAAQ